MPVCIKCEKDKPKEEFYKDGSKTNPNRRKRKCKECIKAEMREKNKTPEHKEYAKNYMREYRESNPSYVQRNREQTRQRDRDRAVKRVHRKREDTNALHP